MVHQYSILNKGSIYLRFSYILFLSFILTTCNQSSENNIHVILSKKYPTIYAESLVDTISFVHLETTKKSILPEYDKCILRISSNLITVYNKVNKSLVVFDRRGKYLSGFNHYGRGPYEYSYVTQLFINSQDEITIVDQGKNVLTFDIHGNILKAKELESKCIRIIKKSPEGFYAIQLHLKETNSVRLVQLDDSLKVKRAIDLSNYLKDPKYYSLASLDFYKGSLVLTPYPKDRLYLLNDDSQLMPFKGIDLGKNAASSEVDFINDATVLNNKAFLMFSAIIDDNLFVTGGDKGIKTKLINLADNRVFDIYRDRITNAYIIPSKNGSMVLRVNGGVRDHKYYGVLSVDEMKNLMEDSNYNKIDEIIMIQDTAKILPDDNFIIQISN